MFQQPQGSTRVRPFDQRADVGYATTTIDQTTIKLKGNGRMYSLNKRHNIRIVSFTTIHPHRIELEPLSSEGGEGRIRVTAVAFALMEQTGSVGRGEQFVDYVVTTKNRPTPVLLSDEYKDYRVVDVEWLRISRGSGR